jgi:4-carboxymuconolactone decarboxylase
MAETKPPRIPPLPREEWNDEARDVFGYFEGPAARENGSRSVTVMTLANHPKLAIPSLDLGKYLLVDSSLSPIEKELVILRVAARYDSGYQWGHHVHAGRRLGMSDEQFEALRAEGLSACWGPYERAFVGAVDQLCEGGRIDDVTWASLAKTMDKRKLMDFIYSVGFFTMQAWAFGAMGIQLEPDFEEFSTPPAERVGKG